MDVATDGYVETVIEDLEEDTYYEFSMACEFDDGIWMEWGPFKTFQTGFDAVNETMKQVMIYPNPASEMLYIQGFEPTEVQVFNALGQLVKTVKDASEINVSDWAEGVYVLRITAADGRIFEQKVTVKR